MSQRTSRKGVFAGGDIVTGSATVILAMGAGTPLPLSDPRIFNRLSRLVSPHVTSAPRPCGSSQPLSRKAALQPFPVTLGDLSHWPLWES